jgi:cell division septation protein DedD
MKKQIQSVIAGAAVVVAMGAMGLGVVGSAQAQSTQSSTVSVLNSSKGPSKNAAAIASVLKLTEAELKTQVQSGKTLAQIAMTQGVSVQSVIGVLVTDMQAHIAQEVASGKITQAQADTKLAGVTAMATERVNSVQPARGEGMQGHGRRGHHNKSETAPNA